MEELSKRKFAQASQRKMNWVLGLYNQWCVYRIEAINCKEAIIHTDLHFPENLTSEKFFVVAMIRFILEICKLNGEEYPPRTIYQIMICIQIHLEKNKVYWKILNKNHPEFVNLYYCIDNLIKEQSQ